MKTKRTDRKDLGKNAIVNICKQLRKEFNIKPKQDIAYSIFEVTANYMENEYELKYEHLIRYYLEMLRMAKEEHPKLYYGIRRIYVNRKCYDYLISPKCEIYHNGLIKENGHHFVKFRTLVNIDDEAVFITLKYNIIINDDLNDGAMIIH